ncbi:MAG: hypothetical protein MZV70_70205 [Desulfobacterales bacterium]|nr:hypothetical protein [Desulfobacterales bacterium]
MAARLRAAARRIARLDPQRRRLRLLLRPAVPDLRTSSDTQYLVTFAVMLVVALVISGLTVRIRWLRPRRRGRARAADGGPLRLESRAGGHARRRRASLRRRRGTSPRSSEARSWCSSRTNRAAADAPGKPGR